MMKSTVTIVLCDDNIYFCRGLYEILTRYFYSLGVQVYIVDIKYACQADLIFCCLPSNNTSFFCQKLLRLVPRKTLFFALKDRHPDDKEEGIHRCVLESHVIYHNMSALSVLNKVATALGQGTVQYKVCYCFTHTLTQREWQVMRYMSREIDTRKISSLLSISVKTVSYHKMNVMRKMGFKRNTELYDWLRFARTIL